MRRGPFHNPPLAPYIVSSRMRFNLLELSEVGEGGKRGNERDGESLTDLDENRIGQDKTMADG